MKFNLRIRNTGLHDISNTISSARTSLFKAGEVVLKLVAGNRLASRFKSKKLRVAFVIFWVAKTIVFYWIIL